MKKILVVHPYDESTLQLERVYSGKSCDILHRRSLGWEDVYKALLEGQYDRVFFLGHGTSFGLCNMKTGEIVFDRLTYERCIRGTDTEIVAIWCNADEFFKNIDNPNPHFCTGMFISEPSEAKAYMIEESVEKINEQFNLFSNLLSDIFDSPIENYFNYLNEHYTGDNPIIKFNREEMLFD
jgi:hypothetical protein